MLYSLICAAFSVIVVISNLLSAKMVALPGLAFPIPAGLVTYPLSFLLSDLVTEIFGPRPAKRMVYLALGMNLLSVGLIWVALALPAYAPEQEKAVQFVLGLTGLRVFASLSSYLIAQVIDVQLYAWIKRLTHSKFLWLRNNSSTCISQLLDTVLVDLIFLWWGLGMQASVVMTIIFFSYLYKVLFSLLSTPLFYFLVFFVQRRREGEIV